MLRSLLLLLFLPSLIHSLPFKDLNIPRTCARLVPSSASLPAEALLPPPCANLFFQLKMTHIFKCCLYYGGPRSSSNCRVFWLQLLASRLQLRRLTHPLLEVSRSSQLLWSSLSSSVQVRQLSRLVISDFPATIKSMYISCLLGHLLDSRTR